MSETITTDTAKPTRRRKSALVAAAEQALTPPTATGALGAVERKRRKANRGAVPSNADPREELRRLVMDHVSLTKKATALANMASDKTNRATGEPIPARLPEDRKSDLFAVRDAMKADASRLEGDMLRVLKQIPIYSLFLSHVYGIGPVVAAYLVSMIDPMTKERRALAERLSQDVRVTPDLQVKSALATGSPLPATKISHVRRFCGLAVIGGRLERPTAGVKLGYCADLRTRLFQWAASLWKNAAKKSADRPNGSTSKYLDVWRDYKERMQHSERYDAGKNLLMSERSTASECELSGVSDSDRANARHEERPNHPSGLNHRKGARAIIHATGWHKAADVLIEDLYVVWRAIEGLPVWPSYYAAKLGYNHGGSIAVNAPRMLTVDEALAMVGEVGPVPARVPVDDVDMGDEDDAA